MKSVSENVAGAASNLDVVTAAVVANCNDISELASSLRGILAKDPIETVVRETGSCLTYNINHAISVFSHGDTVGKILSTVSFLSFIGAFLYYIGKPSKSTLLIMAFTLAAAIYYNWDAVSHFLKMCGSFIPTFNLVPQGGADFDGLVQAITLLLFTLNVRNVKIGTLPKNIIEHLKSYKSIKESLKDIVVFVMKLLEYVLDYASLSAYLPKWALS